MMLLIVSLACLGAVIAATGFALYMLLGRNRYGSKRGRPQRAKLTARPGAVTEGALKAEPVRTIRVYFIKPSHYDDEGYVSLYRYGVQPNNTLTVLAALNEAFNRGYSGQRNIRLETILWDEVCDGVISAETITAIKEKALEDGVELLVGLAGVQSNQYPRGRDLALQFVAQGVTTMMGGFHVSGYRESCEFLNSCGVTTVQGEAENLWGEILEDFLQDRLKPHYSVTNGIRAKTGGADIMVPLIADAQLPVIDDRYLSRFFNTTMTTLDTSRGCPFTCSYCSVKNVMGRAMRSREPAAVVSWVRQACRDHGITSLFLVDDDFFRSPRWEEILTGMAEVKKEFPQFSFMMQVDVDASCFANVAAGETETARHRRAKRFTELSAAAGCYSAFVGIESLNPDNLNFASKYQNTDDRQRRFSLKEARARVIDKYRRVVDNWHRVGVAVHAGYMLGFPFDGPDCGRIAAEALRKIGFDIVSFFLMTPLPGTEDQERLAREGKISDWDFNNLDSQHAVFKHDKLDNHDWMQVYRDASTGFYSLRRTLREIFTVSGGRGLSLEARRSVVRQFIYYFFSYRQGRHPMLGGIWQIRRRDVRRGAITDEEARRQYLGNLRFDAILRGNGDGFATA